MAETAVNVLDAAGATKNILTPEGAFAAQRATAGAGTSVAASASSVQLLGALATRKKAIIVNDSSVVLKVALGFTASATAFSAELPAAGTFTVTDYTGVINGIWASATGNARITSLT